MKKPRLRYVSCAPKRPYCPNPHCLAAVMGLHWGPGSGRIIRFGFYLRRSDQKRIQRFRCLLCLSSFSQATFHPCFRQKKRTVNFPLWHLKASEVSLRRSAVLLGVHRRTVERKLKFLGSQARLLHERMLKTELQEHGPFDELQLDEMQSFEHSKCKPLSIPLLLDARSRFILGVDACSMPAQGPLALVSRRKYGPRPNERMACLRRLLVEARPYVSTRAEIRSDSHPYYPPVIKSTLPEAIHDQIKSRRSAATGQGELKKVKWDPIFALNHTAAMFRANMSRLIRKTWCTTKRIERLRDHLILYAVWHNLVIRQRRQMTEGRAGNHRATPRTTG